MYSPWRLIIALVFITVGIGALFGVDTWQFIGPFILIFIGVSILTRGSWSGHPWHHHRHHRFEDYEETTNEDRIHYSAVFAPLNKKVVSENFSGGKIDTVFGGGEIDLTKAKLAKGQTADLEVNAVFGGIKVIVPTSWNVTTSLTGVFGGFENRTRVPEKPQGKLWVKGSAVFGGGEIVNG